MRRLAVVVGLALVAVFLPGAPAAQAAGTCSINVPPTVWVDRPYKVITATLAADCQASNEQYASWNVRHSYYGPSDIFIFDGTTTDSNGFYDWDHYGTYYVEPSTAYDGNFDPIGQNTRSYVVKSGSGLSIGSSRVGSYVTLSTAATYYSPAADAFRPWGNARVTFQYRTCSTCTWSYLRYVYTASTGRASYRFYAPKARYYRAVSATTSTIWGRTSATIAR